MDAKYEKAAFAHEDDEPSNEDSGAIKEGQEVPEVTFSGENSAAAAAAGGGGGGGKIGLHQNGRFSTFRRPNKLPFQCSKVRWIRLSLALTLLLLIIIIIVVFVTVFSANRGGGGSGSGKSTSTPAPADLPSKFCFDRECVILAAHMLDYLDTAVDPCENFFDFACGSYVKSHIVDESGSIEIFQELFEKISVVLAQSFELLKKEIADGDGGNPSVEKYAQIHIETLSYYESCMNVSRLQALGKKPLIEFLQSHFNWSIFEADPLKLGDNTTSLMDLSTYFNFSLSRDFAGFQIIPLRIIPGSDEKNTSIPVLLVSEEPPLFELVSYYHEETTTVTTFNKALVKCLCLLRTDGCNDLQIEYLVGNRSKRVFEVVQRLVDGMKDEKTLNRPIINYNLMRVEEIYETTTDSKTGSSPIDWLALIKHYFQSNPEREAWVTNNTLLVVSNPPFSL